MATDTSTGDIESFGTVSRTVGTIFRYIMLAATLFGLVVLGVLLVYVANDAIQPLTADPGWHLTFLLTLVLPTIGVGAYLYRRDTDALSYGSLTVGMLVVTLMFGGGAAMIFVDILPPLVWLAYVVALAPPFAVVLALQRRAHRIPFLTRAALTTAAFYLSLFGLPGPIGTAVGGSQILPGVPEMVQVAPFIPLDWMSMAGTLGLGVAAVIGWYAAGIRDRRTGLLAGGAAFVGIVVAALAGPFVGLDPLPAVVLASVSVVPTVAYAVSTAVDRPRYRIGLLVPLAVIGGALVGELAVGALGFAGPQSWVDWQFLTSAHSRTAENAGLYPAIGGSILLMVTVALLSFPLGVGAAVYLEEYAPDNRFTRVIDVNISNLAGVPSVVYGLLGLGVFVTYLGQPTGTVLIGGATLALLILPIVIISSREAIRSVPSEMRQASYGMGATKWQTVRNVVLPRAFPGILTGTILALGRAIGETAPLIMIGAPSVLFSLPTELTSKVSAMPLQVFAWSSLFASEDFYTKAVPAGVVVLVSVLLAMNSVAIVLRNRYQSEQ
ncbi:phosphate ABC transporter permease PstA [Halobaculum halobium]|uniref:Phosphate transport system permease protein PstA n=1 Tax=Halobaculum halobium TaxID=3032281 RepID=A0ABD5TAM5_9EURY|nr:phosphate ABC transporter permease PstA [Halobaculum sp. SYNS20]